MCHPSCLWFCVCHAMIHDFINYFYDNTFSLLLRLMKQQQLQQDTLLLSNGNHGLEDIKQAIEQLTLRSSSSGGGSGATVMLNHHSNPFMAAASSGGVFSSAGPHHQAQALSTGHHGGGGSGGTNRGADTGHHSSYSTSTYSSMSGSECDRQHRRPHHLIRHSSLETINTQVQKT